MPTTSRLALPYPQASDTVDVPRDIGALATALDGAAIDLTPGLLSARPAAGTRGKLYYATDEKIVYRDTGSTWEPVVPRRTLLGPTQVRDVGTSGQIRAGRVLTNADFTDLGLSAPRALWNLADTTDASGNSRTLTNGGAVSFGSGITGAATEAAIFTAGATSHLTATNALKQTYGSWGCWFRTAKRGTSQMLVTTYKGASDFAFAVYVSSSNVVGFDVSTDGTTTNYWTSRGTSDVADDRWHFAVVTWDGSAPAVYVDGKLEAWVPSSTGSPVYGAAYQSATALVYLGAREVDTTVRHYGRIDEAFITADVLALDHVRALYATKIAHGVTGLAPTSVTVNVDRRTRTGTLVSGDFPTQPLVGYGFATGALTTDGFGSLAKTLTNNNTVTEAPDVPGTTTGAANFASASSQNFSASDASLPGTTTAGSMGVWFKCAKETGTVQYLAAYGTTAATSDVRLYIGTTGAIAGTTGANANAGPIVTDGRWHFAVVTYDGGTPTDGLKCKLYLDGGLVASTTSHTSITLGGANKLRIGSSVTPDGYLNGQIGAAFVCGYVLTPEQIRSVYDKAGISMGARSVADPGHLIERVDATNVYAIFDSLDGTHLVEIGAQP